MSNAKDATIAAIYGALQPAISGASVYQDVPDGFTGPMVVLGPMKSKPIGAPNDPDRDIEFTILAMTQGDENGPTVALLAQVETSIAGKVLRPAGWKMGIHFLEDDVSLDEDGVTYVGTALYRILALTDL